MNRKEAAFVIFHDDEGNVYLQEREGGMHCFWGGGVEEGETPEQALFRELEEELKYKPESVKFWKAFDFAMKLHVFLAPAPDDFESFRVFEGKKVVKMSLGEAVNTNFPHIEDNMVLEELAEFNPQSSFL